MELLSQTVSTAALQQEDKEDETQLFLPRKIKESFVVLTKTGVFYETLLWSFGDQGLFKNEKVG